jgi:hypothetical protein
MSFSLVEEMTMNQNAFPQIHAASLKLAKTAALCGFLTISITAGIGHAQSLRPVLPFAPASVSTVPPNGDVNP